VYRTNGRSQRRLQAIGEELRRLPGITISGVLTAEEVAAAAERCGLRFRQRLFSPFVTLWLFVWQALSPDGSCREAVLRLWADRPMDDEGEAISATTGSYCRARQRLPFGLIVTLIGMVAARLFQRLSGEHLWCGRRVKIVDGTTVSMPDTVANQARFPQSRSQKAGLGFPIARLVGVFCWSSGALLAHATGPCQGKNNSELGLLRGLLDQFSAGDLVLGDRYYASYMMVALFWMRGVDVLFPQHQRRQSDFRKGRRLGRKDHVVTWHKPKRPDWLEESLYGQLPETLVIREFRNGRRILVTTLIDAQQASVQTLTALYQTRWHCELDLRAIKQVLAMDILRCQSPDMVEKEIAVHLLAYNLLRALLLEASRHAAVAPRTVSFKAALQTLLAQGGLLWLCEQSGRVIHALLARLASERVGDRPGRCEPRAIKRRPKPRPLLKQPRPEARRRELARRHARAA
jgi:Transposase DDE domain